MMIKPTPGRIVYYYERGMPEPFPAMVSGVLSDSRVHLWVFTNTTVVMRPNTQLLQEDELPSDAHWCEWMPYQKGQAGASHDLVKRIEALEAALEPQKGAA